MMDWFHEDYDAIGISSVGKNNMKNPDKSLSGKRDEREVKICKNRFFNLHSSFFIFPSLRFHRAPICQSTHYRKPQKLPFFQPNDPFVISTPCFLRSKFEYSFTNPRFPEYPMPAASDKGSQPYRNAFRCFEMAGMGLPQ